MAAIAASRRSYGPATLDRVHRRSGQPCEYVSRPGRSCRASAVRVARPCATSTARGRRSSGTAGCSSSHRCQPKPSSRSRSPSISGCALRTRASAWPHPIRRDHSPWAPGRSPHGSTPPHRTGAGTTVPGTNARAPPGVWRHRSGHSLHPRCRQPAAPSPRESRPARCSAARYSRASASAPQLLVLAWRQPTSLISRYGSASTGISAMTL